MKRILCNTRFSFWAHFPLSYPLSSCNDIVSKNIDSKSWRQRSLQKLSPLGKSAEKVIHYFPGSHWGLSTLFFFSFLQNQRMFPSKFVWHRGEYSEVHSCMKTCLHWTWDLAETRILEGELGKNFYKSCLQHTTEKNMEEREKMICQRCSQITININYEVFIRIAWSLSLLWRGQHKFCSQLSGFADNTFSSKVKAIFIDMTWL